MQRNAQRIADRLTMFRPRIGRSLEAMVDMDGAERRQGMVFSEMRKQMQQDGGIETTGESHAPGPGIAPGCKVQQKPGRQITHGLTPI
ncbi:Peptidoglycan-binding protein [Pseudomonas sp. IT-93MI4]